MRWLSFFGLALSCAALAPAFSQTNPTRPLLGFNSQSAATQRSLEARFDATLKKENLREWMQWMTAKPHHLGSPFGREVAEFIAAKFRTWGYETDIETFDVLFPTPKTRVLEMTSPEIFSAALREPQLPEDATSGIVENQLPVFNVYSPDGDVRGTVGLRELRTASGLRAVGGARHRCEGEDRHRPLRGLLARHQAEGGRRTWRHRVPHLFGSPG